MKRLLLLLIVMMLVSGLRMHDVDHLTTIADDDAFLVEDASAANATKYTTAADLGTYLGGGPFGTAASRDAEDTMTDGSNLPDGAAIIAYGDLNWAGGGGGGDNITEGNSRVEVIDLGTGQVVSYVDGVLVSRLTSAGLSVNGSIESDAVASPGVRFLDSDCPGTDKFVGSVAIQYVDGADGAENADIYLRSQEGGANTTQMQYNESAASWEIPSGKSLVLLGGSIAGRIPVGSDITGNISLNTTALHGQFYVVTAACTITLDKVTDVGSGASVMFYIRDASETCTIDVDAADKINRHGTAQTAGYTIDSPGNAGDFICLISHTNVDGSGTDGWITVGYGAADWSDGGAS